MVTTGSIITNSNQHTSEGKLLSVATRVLVRAMLVSSILMAGLVFIGMSVPGLLGFKTMVVTSGSMEPTIQTGDAVIIRPIPRDSVSWNFTDGFVGIGDVITFSPFGAGGMVTHRVMDIKEIQGDTFFQTKGDANDTADANLAAGGAVYGKVALTLPKFGYVLHFTATLLGKGLLIILPILILMASEFRGLLKASKDHRAAKVVQVKAPTQQELGLAPFDEALFGQALADEALYEEPVYS